MESLANFLDAAVLKPELSRSEAMDAMKSCIVLGVRTVCVRPCDIAIAKELCDGTPTGVCVVLGFPHGCSLTASKVEEAKQYVRAGVDEIDMVANYGWIRSGLWQEVEQEIAAVSGVTRPAGIPLKVIFETAWLNEEEIQKTTELCVRAGADFVKTSTGFNGDGATEPQVRTMVEAAAGRILIKPSGGIRDRATAEKFLAMGAHRLGVGFSTCPALCGSSAPDQKPGDSY